MIIEMPIVYIAHHATLNYHSLSCWNLHSICNMLKLFCSFYRTFKLSHTFCGMLKFFHSCAFKLNIFNHFFKNNNLHLVMAPPLLLLLLMNFFHFFCICKSFFFYVLNFKMRPCDMLPTLWRTQMWIPK